LLARSEYKAGTIKHCQYSVSDGNVVIIGYLSASNPQSVCRPATLIVNPIRRVRHDRIVLRQRRQYLPAVAKMERDTFRKMLDFHDAIPAK
jgi:hypothetical protein